MTPVAPVVSLIPLPDVFAGEKFIELPINDKLKEVLKINSFDELTNI